jgi:hypothetical protein
MSEKIFSLWFVHKLTQAYYALPKTDQDLLYQQGTNPSKRVGGKGLWGFNSYWSAEQYYGFGVDEYSSLVDLQNHTQHLESLNWYRYLNAFSILGMPAPQLDGSIFTVPEFTLTKSMFVKAWVVNNFNEASYNLTTQQQMDVIAKSQASLADVGAITLLDCTCRWANESVMRFGIEAYPSLEALQKHSAMLDNLEWHKYCDSFTILGKPM